MAVCAPCVAAQYTGAGAQRDAPRAARCVSLAQPQPLQPQLRAGFASLRLRPAARSVRAAPRVVAVRAELRNYDWPQGACRAAAQSWRQRACGAASPVSLTRSLWVSVAPRSAAVRLRRRAGRYGARRAPRHLQRGVSTEGPILRMERGRVRRAAQDRRWQGAHDQVRGAPPGRRLRAALRFVAAPRCKRACADTRALRFCADTSTTTPTRSPSSRCAARPSAPPSWRSCTS